MPLSPARYTIFQSVGTRFADFAADGSGSRLTAAFAIQRVKLKNDSGGDLTFTFEQGSALGGYEVLERVFVADGAEVEVRYTMPGISPVGAKFQIKPSSAGTGYEATVQYTHLNTIQYSTI